MTTPPDDTSDDAVDGSADGLADDGERSILGDTARALMVMFVAALGFVVGAVVLFIVDLGIADTRHASALQLWSVVGIGAAVIVGAIALAVRHGMRGDGLAAAFAVGVALAAVVVGGCVVALTG